jgi:peptide-methionine (S)-S-oxide reductase
MSGILAFCVATAMCGCGTAGTPVSSVTVPSLQQTDESASSADTPELTKGSSQRNSNARQAAGAQNQTKDEKEMETATFGAGCFWCVEAVFQKLKGVATVKSGYMGGRVPNPTYKDVCSGLTGHAEVIQIEFDPAVISFAELLEVFWSTHDPTTLNRQGADVGTQYRSAIFYHSEEQRASAEKYKKQLNENEAFPDPIVTEIVEAKKMYVAEDYHQNYFNNNPNQPYCRAIIPAKLEKLKKVFADKLKE